jgi:hypothetical protein
MSSEKAPKDLPLNRVTFIFGALSIPLAFAGHLVSLAVVLATLSMAFGLWGGQQASRHLLRYTPASVQRARIGSRLGIAGLVCAVIMWVLWRTNVLLG